MSADQKCGILSMHQHRSTAQQLQCTVLLFEGTTEHGFMLACLPHISMIERSMVSLYMSKITPIIRRIATSP